MNYFRDGLIYFEIQDKSDLVTGGKGEASEVVALPLSFQGSKRPTIGWSTTGER